MNLEKHTYSTKYKECGQEAYVAYKDWSYANNIYWITGLEVKLNRQNYDV